MALEPGDRPLRVLVRRLPDGPVDPEEVAHHRDVAERHARLRHPERAGVHADHQHLARPLRPEPLEVGLVRRAGVDERVVDDGTEGKRSASTCAASSRLMATSASIPSLPSGSDVRLFAMVEPTRDDIDALVGPATPHFAYQLRARVRS